MTQENAQINAYPFIKLILDYLKYSDEYRMRFTTLTCGSYTYTGPIYIVILNKSSILDPFYVHTCFQSIDVNINLLDRYPILYNHLFCESKNSNVKNKSGNRVANVNAVIEGSNPVVNNQNVIRNQVANEVIESEIINSNERGNGNESARRNQVINEVIESERINSNERGNGNESARGNGNESVRRNGNGNRNRPHVNGNGNKPKNVCNYSIEKLNYWIRYSINKGFNLA